MAGTTSPYYRVDGSQDRLAIMNVRVSFTGVLAKNTCFNPYFSGENRYTINNKQTSPNHSQMQHGESGISEIISTVLVIILVIALTAVIGAIVFGWAVPVQKTAYIVTQARPVTITNASIVELFLMEGETVSLAPARTSGLPVKFSLTNGSATYNFVPLPGALAKGWSPGTYLFLFRNASGTWVADSTAPVQNNMGFSTGTWTVTISDATSNTLIAKHSLDLIGGGTPPAPVSPPVANFIGTPLAGNVPLIVQFTDTSTGGTPTAWSWNFGDGDQTNSTSMNPVHRYTAPGTYTVSLTATNGGGSNTKTQYNYITVTALPGFTVEAWVKWNIPPNPGSNTTRQWATIVVDGNRDSNRRYQLQHNSDNSKFEFDIATNAAGGSGTWILSSTSPLNGTWYYVTGVYNQTPGTMAIFVNGVQQGGTVLDSSGLRPSPNMVQVGGASGITFNGLVHQRIFDGEIQGLNTYERALSQAEITANFAKRLTPVSSFTGTPTSGTVPLTVSFADTSTNTPTSWLWNFGDGSSSSMQNPSHTYNATGTYTVSLKATNADGSDTKTIGNYITVISLAPPVASFTGTPTTGTLPLTVSFVDNSTNFPTSWLWNFGDGSSSSTRNPSHTYNATGSYTVSLNATNAAGSNTKTQTGYITVTALPGFTVEAWVKWNADPNPGSNTTKKWATIVVDGTTDNNRRYQLQHNSDNTKFEFALATTLMAGSGTWVNSIQTPVNGTWYYVTGVYNQTPGTMAIYVNGTMESWKNVDSSGLRASPGNYQVGGPLGITYNSLAHQRIFDGNTRGLNKYERSMSQDEISANFASGVPPS